MNRVRLQENAEGNDRQDHAAGEEEIIAITHQRRARVVVLRQLRNHRHAWNFVKGNARAHDHSGGRQIKDQRLIGPAGGRKPQQQKSKGCGNGRGVHERMAPAPARTPVVGNVAYDWVEDRFADNCDKDGESHLICGQADDLVPVDQQHRLKAGILDARADRAEAVSELGDEIELDLGGSGLFCGG